MFFGTAASSIILAQAEPPSVNLPMDPQWVWAGLILGGLSTILVIVNQGLAVIRYFKPDPPVHREFATKVEVSDLERDMREFIKRTEQYRDGLNTELKTIAQHMGEVKAFMQRPRR